MTLPRARGSQIKSETYVAFGGSRERGMSRCPGFLRVQSLPSKYEYESTHPEVGFLLRCFQQLSAPHLATQRLPWARQLVHQRCVLPGPLVLGKGPLNALAPAPDMDRTVSRRSRTQLTYRFNGRTAQPLGRTTAPGGEEPTSRCQTFPSM